MKNVLRLQQFDEHDESSGTFVLLRGDKRTSLGYKVKCLVLTKAVKPTPVKLSNMSKCMPKKYVQVTLALPGVAKTVRLNLMSARRQAAFTDLEQGAFVELSSRPRHFRWMDLVVEELIVARKL